MITASDAWVAYHERNILPETFVELSYGILDSEAQELAVGTGVNEAMFSTAENITRRVPGPHYATFEPNLWVLNGLSTVIHADEVENTGYVSNDNSLAGVTLSFPSPRITLLPGVTINWSSEYGEFATSFAVTVKRGNTVVAQTRVDDNQDNSSMVSLEIENYDSITIDVYEWSLPDHRVRIDMVTIGQGFTFTKNDLVEFNHSQVGDLNCGMLPKQSISFALNNVSGRWNPDNPQGMEKYLSERQVVEVKYGMRVDGDIEWIKGGTFYLSEWSTPSQGMTANFVARDIFEYLLSEPYTGIKTGTLRELIEAAFAAANVPSQVVLHLDEVLDEYTATVTSDCTGAELVQMCANAGGCVIWQDRNGEMHVKPLNKVGCGFTIPVKLSSSHPEISLSKPLRSISVSYGDHLSLVTPVADSGEMQTVTNPLIATEVQARMVADVVKDALASRKFVKGEFRADPRLDLYDIVTVESKYGEIHPVVLTELVYSYTGAFWTHYSGRVLNSEVA